MHQVIRLIAVDPHPVFLEGLAKSLGRHQDLSICALTTKTDTVLPLVMEHQPDIVVMDALMNGGVEAASSIKRKRASTKFVMLASSVDSIPKAAVEQPSCRAWVHKSATGDYLAAAIRIAFDGAMTVDPRFSGRIGLLQGRFVDRPAMNAQNIRFSSREADVVRYLSRGLTNRELAQTLGLCETTIRNYVVRIKFKLQAASRRDVVQFCQRFESAKESPAETNPEL